MVSQWRKVPASTRALYEGPAGGCYWPSNLEGNCGAYWASQEDPDSSELALSVFFDDGMISSTNKEMEELYVRCVREAK